jgi:LysR family transcriptional regulator, glycine cleavage system transcriptional activator
MRLPSLHAVRGFVAAGKHLSFTAAARELNVTQGAVSRLVQSLEADLGVILFERTGRTIALTATGAAYHVQVGEALERIAEASRLARRSEERGVLAVSVLPTLALRWLVPRLSAFQHDHPEILVDLTAGDGPVDLGAARIDLAIRFGTPPWPGAEAVRLMGEEIGVVAAPELLARRPLRAPSDLLMHQLLHHKTRPSGWHRFFRSVGLAEPTLGPAPSFEHFFMLAEAAAAGMGVALMPLFLIEGELASGRLIQALPETLSSGDEGYHLLFRPNADRAPKLGRFKSWLLSQANET